MYFLFLSILLIVTSIISIITKNRVFLIINGGVISILIYVANEQFWVISLILLVLTYIIEYLISKNLIKVKSKKSP